MKVPEGKKGFVTLAKVFIQDRKNDIGCHTEAQFYLQTHNGPFITWGHFFSKGVHHNNNGRIINTRVGVTNSAYMVGCQGEWQWSPWQNLIMWSMEEFYLLRCLNGHNWLIIHSQQLSLIYTTAGGWKEDSYWSSQAITTVLSDTLIKFKCYCAAKPFSRLFSNILPTYSLKFLTVHINIICVPGRIPIGWTYLSSIIWPTPSSTKSRQWTLSDVSRHMLVIAPTPPSLQ